MNNMTLSRSQTSVPPPPPKSFLFYKMASSAKAPGVPGLVPIATKWSDSSDMTVKINILIDLAR